MLPNLSIPLPPLFILHTLTEAGFEAYIVGGAVRDLLNHKNNPNPTDFDFTTNANPEEIQALFPESFYENDFGTVAISHQHLLEQMGMTDDTELDKDIQPTKLKKTKAIDISKATKIHSSLSKPSIHEQNHQATYPNYEITTFRSEEMYKDFRRPSKVSWGKNIEEDLKRRDFTVNSMALEISKEVLDKVVKEKLLKKNLHSIKPGVYNLIDPHSGQRDLSAGVINTVGDPTQRFHEDALRMLRAIRFSVQLNMQITDATFEAIIKQAKLIKHISWERIGDETKKILKSEYPAEGIALLDESGLLSHIMPELQECKGVEQSGHHTTNVWTHSIDALRECPSKDPVVRLATLLHDISKPQTQQQQHDKFTFYNHEVIGARVAKKIAKRLRFSSQDCERVFTLVRHHMFYYQPENSDASIRRFMKKVGLDNINDILDVRESDRLGSGAKRTSWRLEEMKQRVEEQLHQPMSVTDLAINGHDLMKELNLKPGPILGEILGKLLEKVLDDPDLNTKENLVQAVKKL